MNSDVRMDCGWCSAPHARVTENYMDCPLYKDLVKETEKAEKQDNEKAKSKAGHDSTRTNK